MKNELGLLTDRERLVALCQAVGEYCKGTDGNVSGHIDDKLFVTRTGSVVKDADIVPFDDPQASSETKTHVFLQAMCGNKVYVAHVHLFISSPRLQTVWGTGDHLHGSVSICWGGERLLVIRDHTPEEPNAVLVIGSTPGEILTVLEAISGSSIY